MTSKKNEKKNRKNQGKLTLFTIESHEDMGRWWGEGEETFLRWDIKRTEQSEDEGGFKLFLIECVELGAVAMDG